MNRQAPALFEAPLAHEIGVHSGNFAQAFAHGWAEREWEAIVGQNPQLPNINGFGPMIEGYAPFVGQSKCDPTEKPGVIAFRALILKAFPGTGSYGIVRECNQGGKSEHKEGRAWDWKVSVNKPSDVANVNEVLNWLFAVDKYGNQHAMVRRLGVMYIIWNRRIWSASKASQGWRPYTGPNPHIDHVHFSFSWDGANKKTGFWSGGTPIPPPSPQRPVLRYGSRGPAVREVQSRLNRWLARYPQLSLPALVVDGIFGPLTRRIVRAFQSAEGLRADGIVGPLTWERLLQSGTSPAPPSARPSPVLPGAGYPQVSRFVPARYFTRPTRPRHINRVVIHITAGGSRINGTIGWFQNPASRVSAHYIVGQDGEVVQMVRDGDIAWHAGPANSDSIGIEHVARPRGGFRRNDPGLFPTQAQYCSSARLVQWLCRTYNIPIDRVHILGHSEADPRTTHRGCPNAVWDWARYMNMVTGTIPC